MNTDEKHFEEWIKVKKKLHYAGNHPNIKEGQIWWCAFGENIGVEINGKGDYFTRPVLVLRKLNRNFFIGIPLTTKKHDGSWFATFVFDGRVEYAVLAQVRVLSVSRLYNRMGFITDSDLASIKKAFIELCK